MSSLSVAYVRGLLLPALITLSVAGNLGAQTPGASAASEPERPHRLEVQSAMFYTRYRFVSNGAGLTTANQIQHKESFKGRFRFDSRGQYSVNAGLSSGRAFISSWSNTPWGARRIQTNLALKQLYVSASPVKGMEFQYGGLSILRGDSSDITSYDEDGYIVGERISFRSPDRIVFNELSVTFAYLGDTNTPNLFKRRHRFAETNYRQFLIAQKIGRRAAFSADYTNLAGRETLRQGFQINLHELGMVDALKLEGYERLGNHGASGFAVRAEKAISRHTTIAVGDAQIDAAYGNLNADRFLSGKRLFLMGSWQLTPAVAITGYATRATGVTQNVSQRVRMDLVVSYDLLTRFSHRTR